MTHASAWMFRKNDFAQLWFTWITVIFVLQLKRISDQRSAFSSQAKNYYCALTLNDEMTQADHPDYRKISLACQPNGTFF
jgi:hypothetical protein